MNNLATMEKNKNCVETKIDFSGDLSNEYDDIVHKIIPAYQTLYELTQHLLRDKLGAEAKILVSGAGTGKEIIDCSQNNPNWSFTGFDPAEPMLTIARKKVTAASLTNRISLVHGLINDVAEKEFDAATSILVMHFLPDDGTKLSFLKGIADKLKSGAVLILVDLEGEKGSDEFNSLNSAWKDQQLFKRGDKEKVKDEFELRDKEVHCITQKRTESLLEEADFIKIQIFFKAYLFSGYVAVKK